MRVREASFDVPRRLFGEWCLHWKSGRPSSAIGRKEWDYSSLRSMRSWVGLRYMSSQAGQELRGSDE